jgi:hypothetical protein
MMVLDIIGIKEDHIFKVMRRNCLFQALIKRQPISYSDWFLPSKDELNAMYIELYMYGVGNFTGGNFYSSSEYDADNVWSQAFQNGSQNYDIKYASEFVRACRAFTSTTHYNLRDIGQAGGLVFWKLGNNFLEASPSNIDDDALWSNVINVAVTGTGTAIGTGQANTTAIIAQTTHTNSAAKLCDNLNNYYVHTNSAAKLCDDLVVIR